MNQNSPVDLSLNPSGILVIQTAFLGDLLLAIPLLKNIRQKYPEERLSLVCRKGFGSLFLQLKFVDEVFEIEKKKSETYKAFVKALTGRRLRIIFSPHESFTTARWVSQIQAERKIGFHRWWNFLFFTDRIHKNNAFPDSLRQLQLMQELHPEIKINLQEYLQSEEEWQTQSGAGTQLEGGVQFRKLSPVPAWASPLISRAELESIPSRYDGSLSSKANKILALFPGSVWKTKQWSEKGFREVTLALSQDWDVILLLGTPAERELCCRVGEGVSNVLNLAGETTLAESLKILTKTHLVIANDSAGQHMAAVTGTPIVSLFGPTVLKFGYRPWSSQSVVIENTEIGCRPCGKHGHHVCPIGTHECMTSIQSTHVLKAARSLTQ